MKRYLDFEYRGKTVRLYFTMNALLDVQEAYDIAYEDLYNGSEREVFDRKCYLLSLLSYEGKRCFPEVPLDTVSLQELLDVMPFEMIGINEALSKAMEMGFQREYEPEEVDEGLAELKKKRVKKGSKEQRLSEQENT